jgi:hypothetical protein
MARATLEEAENRAREIGRLLGSVMPAGWGFALILNSLNDGANGLMTYLSNMRREDMIKMLREMADKLERGEPPR